ncbi:MAG: polymer-forming cytoskeletal protein [Vicinamibacterales bacterium]
MEQTGHSAPTTRLPSGLAISGDLTGGEDIEIDGRFDGQITVAEHHVEIAASASVRARIVARSVTIRGTVEGSIVAAERVDIQPTATVRGHITAPVLSLLEGARFTGSVDPTRTEAAMRVAQYRQKQGNG